MEHPETHPPLPAEYYRRHAARVRKLANEATTAAVKEHLRDVAGQYERLAERVELSSRPEEELPVAARPEKVLSARRS